MPTVTAVAVVLAFLAGCVTAVVGFRFAHDQSSLPALLDWAALTLVVQLFAACIAVVHARASRTARAGAPGAVPEVDAAGGPGTGGAPHA